MKKTILLWLVLLLAGYSQTGFSAGGPLNEDLDKLIPSAQKVIDDGKQGNAEAFKQDAEVAIQEVQSHPISARQQRILGKMRSALRKGKAGKLNEGVKDVEAAVEIMKQ